MVKITGKKKNQQKTKLKEKWKQDFISTVKLVDLNDKKNKQIKVPIIHKKKKNV